MSGGYFYEGPYVIKWMKHDAHLKKLKEDLKEE